MTAERWRQIERIYQDAAALPRDQRAALLDSACSGDPDLRSEVERMLSGDAELGSFLETPAAEIAARDLTVTQVTPGTRLGPYEIVSLLGAGGMGEVYKARDTRLNRIVAIKMLPQDTAADASLRRRLLREAQTASTLNHTHIVTIHDVLSDGGRDCIVMEFVEGRTLQEVIGRKGLPPAQAIDYARQIADALAAAHGAGIIHRDLKPANIMVTKAGLKVLDFGLAKSTLAPAGTGPSADATLTAENTIVGTLAYMAPEQLAGGVCDARTDIFALGLILYEMVAGKPAFEAATREGLMSAVLRCQPEPLVGVDAHLAGIVGHCIASNAADRWQSAIDLKHALALTALKQPPFHSRTTRSPRFWVLTLGICASVLIPGVLLLLPHAVPSVSPVRLNLSFEGLVSTSLPRPSPDGSLFVYVGVDTTGKQSLFLRPLNSEHSRPLLGTDDAAAPFWSADGRWVAYWANGKIHKIDPSGGPPRAIGDFPQAPSTGAAWNGRGDILLATAGRHALYRMSESDGSYQLITELDVSRTENSHRYPVFAADGNRFYFVSRCIQPQYTSLYVGSLDSRQTRRLMHIESNVEYLAGSNGQIGSLLYLRGGSLYKQPFDGEKLTGQAIRLGEEIRVDSDSIFGNFDSAANGENLIFDATPPTSALTWFDRAGKPLGSVGPVVNYAMLRLAPDGSRAAFARTSEGPGSFDIWSLEIARGVASPLTVSPATDWFPVWSPDGRKIVFSSDRQGKAFTELFEKDSLDPGRQEMPLPSLPDRELNPTDWSRDGRWIVAFAPQGAQNGIFVVPTEGGRKPVPFIEAPFRLRFPRISPDGRWIAYSSDETGRREVYASPFEGWPAGRRDKVQISTGGGDYPLWAPDGKELYYMVGGLTLYSVPAQNLERHVSHPTEVFRVCSGKPAAFSNGLLAWPFDVSPKGDRFLVQCPADHRFVVLLNWR